MSATEIATIKAVLEAATGGQQIDLHYPALRAQRRAAEFLAANAPVWLAELLARVEAAEARVAELESALRKMVDWHERGDMDSSYSVLLRFLEDKRAARALLAHEGAQE